MGGIKFYVVKRNKSLSAHPKEGEGDQKTTSVYFCYNFILIKVYMNKNISERKKKKEVIEKMNERRLRLMLGLIVSMIVLGGVIGPAGAGDCLIETRLIVNGTGDMDRTLNAQTERGYSGKSLEESFYTKWRGTGAESKLEYESTLEIFMGNDTEYEDEGELISTIDYAQTAYSTNANWQIYAKNYDIGASQCAAGLGNTIRSFEVGMDDHASEFSLEGSINGRMRLKQQAVDTVTKEKYVVEDTRFRGRYDYIEWNSYIEDLSSPEGLDDWLGCP